MGLFKYYKKVKKSELIIDIVGRVILIGVGIYFLVAHGNPLGYVVIGLAVVSIFFDKYILGEIDSEEDAQRVQDEIYREKDIAPKLSRAKRHKLTEERRIKFETVAQSEERSQKTRELTEEETMSGLQKIKDLYDMGVLSEEEYQKKKEDILNR